MTDISLHLAGGLTMLIAIAHGLIGATIVVGPSTAPSADAKRILHAIMFLSAVLLVHWRRGPGRDTFLFEGETRTWVIYVIAAMLVTGALGNMWGTRAKHFGGYFLLVVSGLALMGA